MRILAAIASISALGGGALVWTTGSPDPDDKAPPVGIRWRSPSLKQPEVIRVGRSGRELRLRSGHDYRILLTRPLRGVGGLSIVGGRNVVLAGGHITVGKARDDASGDERRALAFRGQTGTVHVERLLIDNSGGDLAEGIQIAAPKAIVQLQNVRVEGVHAYDEVGFSDTHPDLVQVWGGVKKLRVHRFTGVTRYQGFFLKPDRGAIGSVNLSSVNVIGEGPARYLFWKRCRHGYPRPCTGPEFPVRVHDVWARPAPGREFRLTLKPEPPVNDWEGVRQGVPESGDFVSRDRLAASRRPSAR